MAVKKQRVVVLMGGPSSEYEISLRTGKKIMQALDVGRYLVEPVIVTRERQWLIPPAGVARFPRPHHSNIPRNVGMNNTATELGLVARDEPQALREFVEYADVVFIAMHGEFGEDGTVQGLLESLGIPYTGSGALASALGMDKPRSLAIFREAGLTVPEFFVISRDEWRRTGEAIPLRAESAFGLPLVVKPADRGSSVGVTIAETMSAIEAGIAGALTHSEHAIAQRYIDGTEVTCGVLETERGAIPLQPTQIIPKERAFFDYYSKYTPGASEEITPPRLPKKTISKIQQTALTAHHAVGASGMSRTDMILGRDGILYVLEINTIPGMTETSLLPQAAQAIGIPFPKLLDCIIAAALRK